MSVAALARRMGILERYVDIERHERQVTPETQRALLRAMGIDPDTATDRLAALLDADEHRPVPEWIVLEPGDQPDLAGLHEWALTYESGQHSEGRGPLPALPMGRHRLQVVDSICWLLVAPPHLPPPRRGWGVTVPLHGLRGRERGGIGDFTDLCVAGKAVGRNGGAFIGINPIHAGFPTDPLNFSPYAPSHRRRLNADHLTLGHTPSDPPAPLIDYITVAADLRDAQRASYLCCNKTGFDAFISKEGQALQRFATHQALSDQFGPYWNDWPRAFRDPDSADVARFAAENAQEVLFHSWLQYCADKQVSQVAQALKTTGMALGLYLDLAVGTHPFGAETWEARAQFAAGASLGAPPDAFAKDGQNWGLAPFNPRALIETGFAPLAETLRCQLRYAGMLRIDHILGFERAFWVPNGAPGGYVQMPRDAMLAVLRIEAARARATIVGEDLGNVPDGLRAALDASGILGCRVAMFERQETNDGFTYSPAKDYPARTLAAFATHDLPTWAGWTKGADIDARSRLGHITSDEADAAHTRRKSERAALEAVMDNGNIHGFLAQCGSQLVAIQIEDILDVEMQPNLPGTIHEYPNWRQRLPVGAADLLHDPRLTFTAEIMRSFER